MARSTTMRLSGSGAARWLARRRCVFRDSGRLDGSLDDDASPGCDDSRRQCVFVVFETGCGAHLNLWLMPRTQLRVIIVRKFSMGPSRAKGARDDRTQSSMFEVARIATSVHLPTQLAAMSAVGSNERMFAGFGLDPLGGSDRDSCCSSPPVHWLLDGSCDRCRTRSRLCSSCRCDRTAAMSRARRRVAVATVPLDRGAIGDEWFPKLNSLISKCPKPFLTNKG